ncbi:DUF6801 domain-containing protein [Streptomyces violaceoruber]|uniref:Secreted protein n=2 Tax=Streptomyces TaxID=1883 RepID=Q9KXZ1_STRCO|nr:MULTISPECIES: DUF6801 domain-containing protein [Streptomyces]MBQ0947953.1 hypothetical protein [Streptomyces sp. RK76]MCW8118958.1 hypothetical protein [Streptomyces anthocyanicus]MCZ4634153.1 hypothetical protein [Streptomyces rubrogriseus]MDX2924155.1 hypothetical protein [Streptomyces sp. NRRL_B-16638]MDX3317138.1 hypothetical protein [Streptomyces sp. ME03-5684b]
MKATPAAAPRPSRARARTTSIAAFVVLAALVPTTASASGTQEVEAELPYVCTLPSGQLPATVRVSAEFPERAGADEAFTPSDVTTTVELPAEAVADLTARDAAEVRAATSLAVGVAQNTATAAVTWRGSAEPVALPGSGPLTLVTRGDVPSVAGRSDGDLTFSAGALAIDLALGAADPATADPGSLTVDCTLAEDAPGQGLLATVPVGTDGQAPSGSPSSSGPAGSSGAPDDDGRQDGPGDRRPERQSERSPKVLENTPGAAADRDDVPPCRYDEQHPPTDVSLNAYVTGYANVKKMKGAAYLPPSCVLIEQGLPVPGPPDPEYLIFDTLSYANFHYRERKQTPPFEATFLSFDFAPVKATMVLEQTGTMRIDSRMKIRLSDFTTITDTYVRAPLVLHVLDLEVNGTPLDVGSECRTETSLTSEDPDPANFPGDHLVLYGRGEQLIGLPATGYLLLSGGALSGEATIPAFTGCGSDGEDLDRLLTASVSGPGNYIKQVQGQTCAIAAPVFPSPENEGQCTEDLQPYEIPVAER